MQDAFGKCEIQTAVHPFKILGMQSVKEYVWKRSLVFLSSVVFQTIRNVEFSSAFENSTTQAGVHLRTPAVSQWLATKKVRRLKVRVVLSGKLLS
jgi:hypothetical protein